MKTFGQLTESYLSENKYMAAGIDVEDLKDKHKYHDKQSSILAKERDKHKKTSPEWKHINADMNHHDNARGSYKHALDRIKWEDSPSSVKAKIKAGENYASKVSGKIPEVAKPKEKIKNIHDHVHSKLTGMGFAHEKSEETEKVSHIRRQTPYGDVRPIKLTGTRTNTTHSYSKPGTKIDAGRVKAALTKDNVLGERGSHYISVGHKDGTIHVMHKITGKSKEDTARNRAEYNYATGVSDNERGVVHYGAWKKGKW